MEKTRGALRSRMKPGTGKRLAADISRNLVVTLVSLAILIPLLLLVVNSLKDQYQSAVMGIELPRAYHLENYVRVVQTGRLYDTFFNSLIYACVPLAPIIVVTSMAAFVLARKKTRLNNFLYFFIILGITLPTNFVTLFKLLQILHLFNTRTGLCLVYIAGGISFNTFLFHGFVHSIPRELDEAAVIDGCSASKMFFQVVFPLLKPVIATVVVLNFLSTWNDFINPLYFTNSSSKWPMTLAVFNFFGRFVGQLNQWNLVCADIVLTSLPVVIVYAIGQKYIISGMTLGSVKA
jgi:raffinose/stachyose/melibiose transport system permease protein